MKISTQCTFGFISVKVSPGNPDNHNLVGGEIYVRNGHSNCSKTIGTDGEAILKIRHNDTTCITKNGDIYETVVVVTQNVESVGNATVITIDDQLFKVRCDYSNQKNAVAVAKTMNLR